MTANIAETLANRFRWKCYGCGAVTSMVGQGALNPGPCACGEPLSLDWTCDASPHLFETSPDSLWHYALLLPVATPDAARSLGEGGTPLIRSRHLEAQLGFGQLWFKNEATNPTGSFKDRQIAVGIAHARESGYDTVAVVSSGNMACAASAFAARAGMRAVVFTHSHAAPTKIRQAMAYGAQVVPVESPSAAAVFSLCREACETLGWYHLSTAGLYAPFNVEGAKTIAYELYAQTGGSLPDWIVAPVGGGGLLGGVWRGFLDMQRLGLIQHVPRMAGVQAAGCAPLIDAIRDDAPFLATLRNPWMDPHTVAGGIADDILFDGHTALPAIRTTRGVALAVTDDEILTAELVLAQREGLLAEPSSAVTIAALSKLPAEARGARVCCLITGSGIKDLDVLSARLPAVAPVQPTLDAVQARLRQYMALAATNRE